MKELVDVGILMEKIVVGKLVADTGNGWISASDFGEYIEEAWSGIGWSICIMGWEWNST